MKSDVEDIENNNIESDVGENINAQLFRRAKELIPGGVNSPVRSFKYVSGIETPLFVKEGRGSKLILEDGRDVSDYVMSWGALILGHSHPAVINSVISAVEKGTSFGLCHQGEIEFASFMKEILPDFLFRAVNSGTEACMSAVRVARGFTGKKVILKFEGCYHGHSDQFLTSGGSGLATLSIPASRGVPEEFTSCTVTLPFNAEDNLLEDAFRKYDIAGVILEVLPGNMGVVPPERRFLEKIKELCEKYNALLIYDEVITGFRVGWGGITGAGKITLFMHDEGGSREESFSVPPPDLITFGKVVGGGFPVGVFGGREDIMRILAPEGDVYQAGTLSGNPVSLQAGISTLKFISETEGFYEKIKENTLLAFDTVKGVLGKKGIKFSICASVGMLSVFFCDRVPRNFSEVKVGDSQKFSKMFAELMGSYVLIPPSPFEAWFISYVHSEEDIDRLRKGLENL